MGQPHNPAHILVRGAAMEATPLLVLISDVSVLAGFILGGWGLLDVCLKTTELENGGGVTLTRGTVSVLERSGLRHRTGRR